MKIYVAHRRNDTYQEEIYNPIRTDEDLKKYEIILPHEEGVNPPDGREFYKTIDVMIAECSYHATGLGIELRLGF